jgi:hypothetical protein
MPTSPRLFAIRLLNCSHAGQCAASQPLVDLQRLVDPHADEKYHEVAIEVGRYAARVHTGNRSSKEKRREYK